MQQSRESEWNEACDKEFADWKRVREAIGHENTLTNYRLMWFLLSQGFLFTAFASVFVILISSHGSSQAFSLLLSLILSSIGFFVSFYLGVHLRAGQVQHDKLYNWWNDKYGQNTGFEKAHPPICGKKFGEDWIGQLAESFPPYSFTVVFGISWFILFFICFMSFLLA